MSTITAAAQPSGTVRLDVVDDTFSGIVRTDVNGSRLVRLTAAERGGSGTFTLTDHEAAASGRIEYSFYPAGTGLTSTTFDGIEFLPRFLLPAFPILVVTVATVHEYAAARESGSTFHKIIGRRAPAVALGNLAPRTGSIGVLLDHYADAHELEALLDRGEPAMYRQSEHAGMDMYFHVTGTALEPDEGKWTLTISFAEIEYPSGDVADLSGWTFGTLAGAYSSFAEVTRTFASFDDLTVNREAAGE